MGRYKSQEEAEAAGIHIRKVQSFILREGRLTKGQAAAIESFWSSLGIDYQASPFDIDTLFPKAQPIVIEIGFGMGQSLIEMAQNAPELNFIGIEVHKPGVGACISEAHNHNLTNLKVMEHDAVEALKNCIPDNSLHRVQLYFPDPWHKKRHHKRRIVQPEFAELVRQKLAQGGIFHMATDWENYAEQMLEVMLEAPGYKNCSENNTYVARPDFRPMTKFEKRGEKLGHGVWDLIFEKE
ncbi:tRNA (guanosine(46)-N7)-methyltransferase TrmB [Alteromonas sp. a30]|uniref:tRNA (guanosine(46)-N7)-methyltransferase TrmB n=1 Tax=Alteromonas sp. a30 TaxID=2730917 RepID=UPI00227F78CE|nr:tRNA (guanosine(46)-N7)-methyltransferase TrmB [Alteromonas sp. a30]MCY7297345.1 tRNA (guanosine(46)-N7)-methyltransferase TrmB [Alteromonas sp. a30]